ncbi:DUF421 domain-containing protein [Rossellomorea aquimaris]|uniref:DUF421 domain-containing protein n=1 Tax=Rossellomorea aquimaris TaxID=189382 RepID=UPI0007D05179|nr:DUF421 domain-containing protein [Rossellomorea aquimaris]
MDVSLLWKAVIIVIGGTLLLRIAGRKSISQMSLAQVVIMIGIGSLLVQPIAGEGIWSTLIVGLMLVLSLIIIEYAQLKIDLFEKFISGRAKVLIKNGELQVDTLRKLRFSVDQLEMKLRQNQISSIKDIKEATLEPNGQLGFVLNPNKQPASNEDIQLLRQEIFALKQLILNPSWKSANLSDFKPNQPTMSALNPKNENDLFNEISSQSHSVEPPENLQ